MDNPTVLLETTSGDILIELYADKVPPPWRISSNM